MLATDNSPAAELNDYLPIQPRRTDMVMKWINEPFLKVALEGTFCVLYSVLVYYCFRCQCFLEPRSDGSYVKYTTFDIRIAAARLQHKNVVLGWY